MQTKHHNRNNRSRQDAGIALVTSLLLMFLMSSLLVGFCILLISNQQLAGSNNADVSAFYGAETGMEQMTANLGNLFSQTYAPTLAQLNALSTNPGPPVIPGLSYVTGSGASGYTVTWPNNTSTDSLGNPLPNQSTVKIGPYTGLTAYTIDYVLTVNARTTAGREVKLTRTTQTVAIPAFSFGVFCGVDCAFFAGPTFNFGGRTHSNGNLFLAEGNGATLTLSDKVDAYGDIVRTELSNGFPTSSNYTGTVSITTNPGTGSTCNACRNLGMSEGSYDLLAGSPDASWPTISTGTSPADYNHNLIDGLGSKDPTHSTGAKQLNLAVAIMGNGATQAIDLNRRALGGEAMTITAERYYDQASLRILLSDNKNDLMNLPCIDGSTNPMDLGLMATTLPANWGTSTDATLKKLAGNLTNNNATNNNFPSLPLPLSGANLGSFNATDGYWLPVNYPIVKGFIKIEEQTSQGNASGCGTWKDVTAEILGYGYAGRNIDPVPQSWGGHVLNPQWPVQDATHMQPLYTTSLPYPLQLRSASSRTRPTLSISRAARPAPIYFLPLRREHLLPQ
jgi:Tfp pilus assembly protein PilX